MDFSNMEVTIDHIADAGAKIKAYATVTFDGMSVSYTHLAKNGKNFWKFCGSEADCSMSSGRLRITRLSLIHI